MSEETKSRRKRLLDKFLDGLASSIGSWVGTTIVVGILLFIVSKIDFVPIIGNFVAHLIKYIQTVSNPFNL
jgi:hypothetical protein